ncbi:MAG: glycerol kinase GlpK [Planctomycetes bacterium]|nr:glycerol kinase GlpK [Planctomycetota bacterium]
MAAKSQPVLLAIDQGTTGTKALILDDQMHLLAEGHREFPQIYPRPGWVEHDPEEIWKSVRAAVTEALRRARIPAGAIAAIGITNQRETTVVWDRRTGKPAGHAIVWQDRRTAPACEELRRRGCEPQVRRTTGLLLDPYFSATKLAWILDRVPGCRRRAEAGKLAFGTIDSYVLFRLTAGAAHATDVSNASRTLLFNLRKGNWDAGMLELFRIPRPLLPEVHPNNRTFGSTRKAGFLPDGIPVAGMIGDQQSALFGQACYRAGEAKCTYGTGAFLLANTGERVVFSRRGLLTTAAWRLGERTVYALEGSVFIAGAIVQWLRDGLGIIKKSSDIEALAASVPDSGEVTLVPALVGLGAPHWRPEARGVICGLTRGATAAHLARAALEGIAFQCHDVLKAMEKDLGRPLKVLKVDGGAAANDLLLQFQADILGTEIVRPRVLSTTALGAALLAGLAIGLYPSLESIAKRWEEDRRFHPRMPERRVEAHLQSWREAVRKA